MVGVHCMWPPWIHPDGGLRPLSGRPRFGAGDRGTHCSGDHFDGGFSEPLDGACLGISIQGHNGVGWVGMVLGAAAGGGVGPGGGPLSPDVLMERGVWKGVDDIDRIDADSKPSFMGGGGMRTSCTGA